VRTVIEATLDQAPSRTVLLYDGDCAFCTSCARFVERRMATSANLIAWQLADLEALGVTQGEAENAILWVGARPAAGSGVAAGPAAVARLLVDAGGGWRPLGRVLDLPPVRAVAWPVYQLVARNRHRLPGGTPACALPQAERQHSRT
jgi:predicted DCC family thiol-disulfide oxidoreductase YuxK